MNKWLMFNGLQPLMAPDDQGSGSGTSDNGSSNGDNGASDNIDNKQKENDSELKFSQDDVNKIAAKEKKQGAAGAYKELGFESAEEAKKAIEAWRKIDEDKKDELTKAQEAKSASEKERNEAVSKAEALERKFQALELGVPVNNVDAVVLLATAKLTDGTEFKDALEEVKKSYPSLFEVSQNSNGTGSKNNPARRTGDSDTSGSLGKKLAEQKQKSVKSSQKSPYFTR